MATNFLPQKPIDMIRSGNYKKNVNILMGTTDDEGSLLLTFLANRTKFSISNPENITKSEAKEILDSIFTKFLPIDSIKVEDIYNLYISQLPEDNFDAIRRSLGVAFGDFILTCPTIQFGKLLFNGDSNNSRVYQYLWSAKYHKTWHGADHGSEVEYFFGSPFRETNTTDESFANKRRVSLKLIEILSHFTRNGNLPPQEGIEWKSYYNIDNNLISPYYEVANDIKPEGNFGFGFKYECHKLWRKLIIDK